MVEMLTARGPCTGSIAQRLTERLEECWDGGVEMGQVSANTDRTREKLTEGEPRTDGQREGMKMTD